MCYIALKELIHIFQLHSKPLICRLEDALKNALSTFINTATTEFHNSRTSD